MDWLVDWLAVVYLLHIGSCLPWPKVILSNFQGWLLVSARAMTTRGRWWLSPFSRSTVRFGESWQSQTIYSWCEFQPKGSPSRWRDHSQQNRTFVQPSCSDGETYLIDMAFPQAVLSPLVLSQLSEEQISSSLYFQEFRGPEDTFSHLVWFPGWLLAFFRWPWLKCH